MIPNPPPAPPPTEARAQLVTFAPVAVGRIADGPDGPRWLARPSCCPHRLFVGPTKIEAIRLFVEHHVEEKVGKGGAI